LSVIVEPDFANAAPARSDEATVPTRHAPDFFAFHMTELAGLSPLINDRR